MENSKLNYLIWIYAIYMIVSSPKGVSSTKVSHDLGITQKTAWHLLHRIRQGWLTEPQRLDGTLEFDETFIGGKFTNMHRRKRKFFGRGTHGKATVIGVRSRDTGYVYAAHIGGTSTPQIEGFVYKNASDRALVYSDEGYGYTNLQLAHRTVKHQGREYVTRDGVSTNSIESFWALLKRAYKGVFHWMSHRHLHRYVTEFCGRFNYRWLDTLNQMKILIRGFSGKTLDYKTLVS